jgi:ketosteroid isomerase-like protein
VSAANVDLHRRFVEAFNARNIEALIEVCHPDIELHSVFAAVGGAVYRGHDEMRRWHEDLHEAWGAEIHLETHAYFDLGERTLAFYDYFARGQQSGATVAMPAAAVMRWHDGRTDHVKVYLDRDEALKDVGASEDELEPIAP